MLLSPSSAPFQLMTHILRASRARRAAFGACLVAVAVALNFAAPAAHLDPIPYSAFGPAIALAVLLGRRAGGVAASIMSLALVLAFDIPRPGAVDLILFIVKCVAVVAVAEVVHELWLNKAEQDRIRADELARAQQRLALALEAGAIGAFEADLVERTVHLSEKLREIWGWAGDAPVKPDDLDALVIEDDRAARDEARRRTAEENGRYIARFRIRRANDGALRWIDTRGQVHFEGGRPVRALGVTRDVTDEMEAAEALKERAKLAEQLTVLASALPGAIYSFMVRPDGGVFFSYAAPQMEALLGADMEICGRDLRALEDRVHRADVLGLVASIFESAREKTLWRAMFRYKHPTRGEIWLEGHSRPIQQDDGGLVWHGYLQDVTARESVGRALSESEARVRALKDERLAALEKWAARLAHEVNQPLAAGATLLVVARRRLERAPRRDAQQEDDLKAAAEALEKAAQQLLRAGDIVGQLREFSRHGEPDKTFRGLHDTIRETLANLKADSRFADVEIVTRFAAERDEVLIDRVQIMTVVANLVQNAKQALVPEGSRTIVVASRNRDENIEISVIDYGSGLSDDARRNMFELFWTTKTSGMGVGLAMAQTIIEAHSGTIWPQDGSAEGTVFTFSLPLIDKDEVLGELA